MSRSRRAYARIQLESEKDWYEHVPSGWIFHWLNFLSDSKDHWTDSEDLIFFTLFTANPLLSLNYRFAKSTDNRIRKYYWWMRAVIHFPSIFRSQRNGQTKRVFFFICQNDDYYCLWVGLTLKIGNTKYIEMKNVWTPHQYAATKQ